MQAQQPKIIYLGNRLERHGFSPTGIDKLSVLLAEEFDVVTASHKLNKGARLMDMLAAIIRNRDAAAVLIDTYSTSAFYFAAIASAVARLVDIPYVPILHGGNLVLRLGQTPALAEMAFGKAVINVAPSKFLATAFRQRGFKCNVIPNPLAIDEYQFTRRHEVRPRLLYVRSFDRTYNPCLAVKVLAKLAESHKEATLCMVGPDKDGSRAEVETLARALGVSEQLRITGKLAPTVWRDLSRDYDIFINTTNVDNTPVSVLEAMALGLPVVSTSAGGLPYLISHERDGFLVDCNAESQFVDAINRLIESPELVAKVTWNARNTAERHSEDEVTKSWVNLLQKQVIDGSMHSNVPYGV